MQTTAITAYEANLIAAFATANPTVQFGQSWLGPTTASKGLWIGDSRSDVEPGGNVVASSVNRMRRIERFEIEIIAYAWREAPSPKDADDAKTVVRSLLSMLDSLLAENPSLRTNVNDPATRSCEWSYVAGHELHGEPFQTGWAFQLSARITGTAHLT